MKRFGTVIFEIKEYLILTLLVVISLYFIFSNDNPQIRFLRAIAITSIGTFQSGISAIPNIFDLQQENKHLRENNIRLSNELSLLKEAKLENLRLNKLLLFKEKANINLVSAKIINKSLLQTRNTITLNIGENDGVFSGMPVITDDGLVGKVVSTSNNFAIAQILLNKELKVTVKNQRSRVDGILNFDGVDKLIIKNVPKNADVAIGDLIITSEYSNLFPSGIPVGFVTESGQIDNLFKKIVVSPSVNFVTLEEVFVIKLTMDKERYSLEKTYTK